VSPGAARVVLLPSLREGPDLASVVSELCPSGPVALITAGWQEWEDDTQGLREALGPSVPSEELRLYARADRVWDEDPELAEGHGAVQSQVRLLRRIYIYRLAGAMDAWIQIQGLDGDPEVVEPEQRSALDAVRALDEHHRHRLDHLRREFYRQFDPLMRASVSRERERIAEQLSRCSMVVIAGGHIPVLLNRIRLFGLDRLLDGKVVVALGGGAMALAEQVVLFHDSPPWGPGHAEVGEVGQGLYPAVVALPGPSVRLRLDDPARVTRMARRFDPATCLLLESGTRVDWVDGGWQPAGARRLGEWGSPEVLQGPTMRTESVWSSPS